MSATKLVTFLRDQVPPLRSGSYALTATVTVNQDTPDTFAAGIRFAVQGKRFRLAGDDIVSVYPQNLSNGSFETVLPHVVLRRPSLPWQRISVNADPTAPWLALLLFPSDDAPEPRTVTVADLAPAGATIADADGKAVGAGTLASTILSYPGLTQLEYGESPTDEVTVIDIDFATFNAIAPTAADLALLAHIRIDQDGDDTPAGAEVRHAMILGNRLAGAIGQATVFLVSLDNFGACLPDDEGRPPAASGTPEQVRLVTFMNWRYSLNELDQAFAALLEAVNRDAEGQPTVTTLRLPGPTPDATAVSDALAAQASGALTATHADTLVHTALAQGYVAMNHALRRPGATVSWYRGPLAPLSMPMVLTVPLSGPDAANRYDPTTGMFDVSYGAAWQIGQLLGLQSRAYSQALYRWRQQVRRAVATAAEQAWLETALEGNASFNTLVDARAASPATVEPDPPVEVTGFIGDLRTLRRVPFAYLVPDEGMLPPESLRVFQVDNNWVEALVDGAFSIGRVTSADLTADAARTAGEAPAMGPLSGFLLRSQVVAGWPAINVDVFGDAAGEEALTTLRLDRLSDDVLFCLVEGTLARFAIHLPTRHLHSGPEGSAGAWFTTLRAVNDGGSGYEPGQQLFHGSAPATAGIHARADGQTLQVSVSAAELMTALNSGFNQGLTGFTAEQWALQIIQGVVSVDYQLTN